MASGISNMPLEIPTNMENKANHFPQNPCGDNISRLCSIYNYGNHRDCYGMDAFDIPICYVRCRVRAIEKIRKNLKPFFQRGDNNNAKTQRPSIFPFSNDIN